MRPDEPAGANFKHICADFLNLTLITKSAKPVEIQVSFGHAPVGNNFPGETVRVFALAGSLESPMVASIDADCAFASDSEKIRLLVTEVLICTAVGDLERSKKLRYWESLNAVLLLKFLTKEVVV